MPIHVDLKFDKAALMVKIKGITQKGIAAVSNEALKDANYYARMDTGELIRSSIRASNPKKGELVWDTPYAKRVYYTGVPSTDANPNARTLWAHHGFAENKDKYQKILEKTTREG